MTAADFAAHEAFERVEGQRFAFEDGDFEATVDAAAGRLRVEVPTLPAVVEGDAVGDAVADGWYRTLERRLEHVEGVTRGPDPEPPAVVRGVETVTVELDLADGEAPAEDAAALTRFVEGTWFEGVVPGYDYREDVEAMRNRAHDAGGDPTPL
jgi:hypothetical protein